jgi:Amt family ammonium transporter
MGPHLHRTGPGYDEAGVALFCCGLVGSKHILGTIMQSVVMLCLVSLIGILAGYSLAFGPDKGGLIGSREWVGLGRLPGASSGCSRVRKDRDEF